MRVASGEREGLHHLTGISMLPIVTNRCQAPVGSKAGGNTTIAQNDNGGPKDKGRWLKALRLKNGLYQHQLAALLDINQGRISEWEHGKPMSPDDEEAIKSVLQ